MRSVCYNDQKLRETLFVSKSSLNNSFDEIGNLSMLGLLHKGHFSLSFFAICERYVTHQKQR